ncbi:unnamed protein product [Orchesella dallaii]|uniref:MADF domain-containing protein n=1 Tax=Orchesella dallaii TaxID=48710 RepID=A0ABP1RYB4_9HEXA
MGGKKGIRRLSNEEKIKLASVVEKHPSVWDKSNPNYSRLDKLAKTWESIAGEMDMSGNLNKLNIIVDSTNRNRTISISYLNNPNNSRRLQKWLEVPDGWIAVQEKLQKKARKVWRFRTCS